MTMNIDEYLKNLRNDLDSQLTNMGAQLNNPYHPQQAQRNTLQSMTPQATNEYFCEEEWEKDTPQEYNQIGILLTNTKVLAEKYECNRQEIHSILNSFISNSAGYQQGWFLLDCADYADRIDDGTFYLPYNELISDFIESNQLQVGADLCLFIIGGDDVIPIPLIEDPYGTSDDGRMPTDMAYCFSDTFLADLLGSGNHCIGEEYVRNNVSRLPLEDGSMNSNPRDDIERYLSQSLRYMCIGIDVDKTLMTSHLDWADNSNTMSHHLPLVCNHEDGITHGDMYVSPKLKARDSSTCDAYVSTMKKADMLVFNLHGGNQRGASGFYSNDEAFSIDMMLKSKAPVLNTVACFGARYHGYARKDSMLLSAIYNGPVMLYSGSLISVPMMDDASQHYPEGATPKPGSGSEKLMPIICTYQYSGMPAGKAMLLAKLDYFSVYRAIERDDFSLATAMMFGLYGNPMLYFQRIDDVVLRAREEQIFPSEAISSSTPIHLKHSRRVYEKNDHEQSASLVETIRQTVDNNLSVIHQQLAEHLYQQLGLEPRWLTAIDEFEMEDLWGNLLDGFTLEYDDLSKTFGNKTWVETDKEGRVTRVTTTK